MGGVLGVGENSLACPLRSDRNPAPRRGGVVGRSSPVAESVERG
ncbi:hypothetical protein SynMEDNS5_01559 [Synechococcus sp. MEDNS5]|nr:hypothetical protein SynMEDNS5_01559 [Synechococcus sp. MEDNS5]